MNLYLVHAELPGEDGRGSINMDLVLCAPDVDHALRFWKTYYSEWDKPELINVWTLPTAEDKLQGVIEWGDLPCHEFKVPHAR